MRKGTSGERANESTREGEKVEKATETERSKDGGDSGAPGVARRIWRNLLVPAGPRQNRLSVHYFRVGAAVENGERVAG